MAHYRYVFLSLITEQVLSEIPMYGVYFQRKVSDPGQFQGTFNFDQSGIDNTDLVNATIPGRTYLVVERNNVPVWWGIVWSRTYQSQAKSCQLFAWGFEAYPQKQKILTNISYTNQPHTYIFTSLWNHMQAVYGRNLNIEIPSKTVGPNMTLTVAALDNVYYSAPMDAIASVYDGFDWTIDCVKVDDATYNKSLRVGYPYMGTDLDSPTVTVFEYPGNILNYYSTESMSDAATNVFALGQGEGTNMIKVEHTQQTMLDTGWPRYDTDVSYKDIGDRLILEGLANQEGLNRKPPMPTFTVTVKGDLVPEVGAYTIGDAARLIISDSRYPIDSTTALPGLNIPTIIVGYEVRPPAADGVEEVGLIFPGDVQNG